MVAILVVITIVVAVAVDAIVLARRRRVAAHLGHEEVFPMAQPHPPHGIFLDEAHSWVRITADGSLRVGIDEFLAQALGEVDDVEVPARGTQVKRGEPLVRLVVNGREVTVPAPATGEVVGANEQVINRPWLVARDPYGVGWAVSLWTRDHQEAIRPLRIGSGLAGFLQQEMVRLADFLTGLGQSPQATPLLADGGVPRRGVIGGLSEGALEEFEREFLATREE